MNQALRLRFNLQLSQESALFCRLQNAKQGDIISLLTFGLMAEQGALNSKVAPAPSTANDSASQTAVPGVVNDITPLPLPKKRPLRGIEDRRTA